MSQYNQIPVNRTENQAKEINKMLTSLASAYKDGNMFSVKRTVKDTTKGPKETCNKTGLVRGATKARIETYLKDLQYSRELQSQNAIQKPTHFAGLNIYGPISDVATYFASRLSPDKSYFYSDAAQFAFAALLSGLVKHQSEFVIDESNVSLPSGNVKVLKGLVDFAAAGDDEVAKTMAIDWLYQYFVLGAFDAISQAMRENMSQILAVNNSNVGFYNSAVNVRAYIQSETLKTLPHYYDVLKSIIDRPGMYVELNRSDWLEMKAAPKKKSDVNHISLTDLPAVARDLGVLTEVVATLPPKYRREHNGVTYYQGIEVQPQLAHKLWYVTGVSYKVGAIDSTPHTQTTEGGKRRTKVLNHEEAKARIIKNIAKYFEAGTNGKAPNIRLLLDKEKFLDITGANLTQATGLQIASQTANTIFLFPSDPLPVFQTKEQLIASPQDVFRLIKCCLGYPLSKAAECTHSHIVEVVKDLHRVFGLTPPDNVQYNNVSSKGGSSNAFSSIAPAAHVGYGAQMFTGFQQPMMQQHFAPSSSGGEI